MKVQKLSRDLAHPPLNFKEGQKVRNLALFSTSLDFESPPFEKATIYLHAETISLRSDRCRMSSQILVKVGPRTTENVRHTSPCKNSGKDGRDFSSFTYDRISRIHLIAIFCAAAERGGLTKVQHLLRPSDITTWAAKSCFRNARVTLKNNWHVFLAHSVYLELQFCRETIQVMIRSFIYLVHN